MGVGEGLLKGKERAPGPTQRPQGRKGGAEGAPGFEGGDCRCAWAVRRSPRESPATAASCLQGRVPGARAGEGGPYLAGEEQRARGAGQGGQQGRGGRANVGAQ